MLKEDACFYTGVGAVSFVGAEALSYHLTMKDLETPPTTEDWVLAFLIGGPAFFFLFFIVLLIIASVVASLRNPR